MDPLRIGLAVCALVGCCAGAAGAGDGAGLLPGTAPLGEVTDRSAEMVSAVDRLASRELARAGDARRRMARDAVGAGDLEKERARLRECIGAIDARAGEPGCDWGPAREMGERVGSIAGCAGVYRVRWVTLEGVWGEGLRVVPDGGVKARVALVPDADSRPEDAVYGGGALAARLARAGCDVWVPDLLSRGCEFSGSARLKIRTDLTHREWIYRQAYELGRHIVGYEVLKVLSAIDWMERDGGGAGAGAPIGVAGYGEGGLIALLVGALDPRVDVTLVSGYFGSGARMWEGPIYRNLWGYLERFGDAGVARLIAPRRLLIETSPAPGRGAVQVPEKARKIAAPGVLLTPGKGEIAGEATLAREWAGGSAGDWLEVVDASGAGGYWCGRAASRLGSALGLSELSGANDAGAVSGACVGADGPRERQGRQVRELEWYTQRLVDRLERERDDGFWRRLPQRESGERYGALIGEARRRFWEESIGRLPDPDAAMEPRSRLIAESDTVRMYEVTLGVWEDVSAWGLLCLPRGMRDGERRPVVVCQHGLEGVPADVVDRDEGGRAWRAYKAFAWRLAECGFVTFAPHNPYRGGDAFRVIQRKLNPVGLSLFSVIVGQHQRILEWLGAQPFCDASRIGFYGLSYGGKSAMRIPAVLPGYALSICSGDFNDWIRKNVSVDAPLSYVYAGEYEIWEFGLGRAYNYAEMAALIAPRPFMVERGHGDGVGYDEWVAYEYARVRRLYDRLGIGGRTEIEFFDGPHTINGVGTFEFLRRHLGWSGAGRGDRVEGAGEREKERRDQR